MKLLKLIACGFLLVFLALAAGADDDVQVDSSSSSTAAHNVQAALDFLARCKSTHHKTIEARFKANEIYITKEGYSYCAWLDNSISIDSKLITPVGGSIQFDPAQPTHFSFIADLARAMVHESYHSDHHSVAYFMTGNLNYYWLSSVSNFGAEVEAYSATIVEIDRWIDCRLKHAAGLAERGDLERARELNCKANQLVDMKRGYIRDYRDEKYGGLSITDASGKLLTADSYISYLDQLERELDALKDSQDKEIEELKKKKLPPETTSPTPSSDPNSEMQHPEGVPKVTHLKTEFVPGPPTKCKLEWTGKGQASGEVLELKCINDSERAVTVHLTPGLVLNKPSKAEYQSMILASQEQIRVPAGETVTVSVRGYCLDHSAPPPPAGEKLAYTFSTDLNEHSQAIACLLTGQDLAAQGRYHQDLGPKKHVDTVIQRAIWVLTTRNSERPHNREKLEQDLKKQVEQTGGKQSDEQIKRLADNLWEDIDLTVKQSEQRKRREAPRADSRDPEAVRVSPVPAGLSPR